MTMGLPHPTMNWESPVKGGLDQVCLLAPSVTKHNLSKSATYSCGSVRRAGTFSPYSTLPQLYQLYLLYQLLMKWPLWPLWPP